MVNIQRSKLLVSVGIGITCGLLILLFARGPDAFIAIRFSDSNASQVDLATPVIAPSNMRPPSAAQESATRQTSGPTPTSPAGVSTAQTIRVPGEKGEDLDDVLLLYDSAHEQNFDINFCQLASYYGVSCKRLNLRNTPLTDDLLRDARGDYFRLIGISARTLEAPLLVLPDELALIKQSVKVGGANLLVAELVGEEGHEVYPNLESLTDNVVLGAKAPKDSRADWFISSQMPDLTREFTGQVISCTQISQPDSAIILAEPLSTVGMPIVALGPSSTPALTTPAPPTPAIYVVRAGDTLIAISKQYEINWETLQEANAILDPRRLQIGQELVIPREKEALPTPRTPALPTPVPTLTPAIYPRKKEALTAVITSVDDLGAIYPIFVHYKAGAGSILVSAGDPYGNLAEDPMRDIYEPCAFSELVPPMFAFRFALGDEVWHSNYAYANLTIDDPALRDHSFGLRYAELLVQMKEHNFHTTISFMPINYDRSDPLVSRLFLTNPDYLSVVQHGNNNDLYEFYKYEVSQTDPYPARPLTEQKADIIEGLARMEEHKRLTGVPYGKIMIFPYGISPAPTLVWLKANNFHATINDPNIPLDSKPGESLDFNMYQATMNYGSFPSIGRRGVPPGGLSRQYFQWLFFDLFIGKPILLYSHVNEVFRHGMDGFNQTADAINQLPTAVEWRSLDYIVKHLYLEKRNDDGSIDVKWYGNHVIITNASKQGEIYHLQKEETLNVPIASLTVSGEEFPFRVENNTLLLDLYVPARTSVEVVITYGL